MKTERAYHIFPSVGNSPRVNELNFLAWQIDVGEEITFGVIRRAQGSHLGAAKPKPLIRFALREDIEIEWLGDAIIGCRASGEVVFRAAAIDEGLLLELPGELASRVTCSLDAELWHAPVREDNPLSAVSAGRDWRLSWETTTPTGSMTLRVEPTGDQASAVPAGVSTRHSDLDRALATSEEWVAGAPSLTGYPEFRRAWDHTWILHRIATFPPVAGFPYSWETPGRGYLFHYFGHWDAVHNVLDMLWLDPDHCASIVRNLLRLQDPDDGRFGVAFSPLRTGLRGAQHRQAEAATSPPLWAYAAVEVFRRTSDIGFLAECYKAFRRNVIWFETYRQFPRSGLFWHNNLEETGYDNVPRGETRDAVRAAAFSSFAAVDLSSQMVKYYRDLADMADLLGERSEAAEYRRKADTVAATIRTTLWDEDAGFFFDANTQTGRLDCVKTIAGFWPMISGVADEAQVARLVEHLTNPSEFWAPYPVPSVSRDEAAFCLDCWRGPVWASQNLWIILGLQDYGY